MLSGLKTVSKTCTSAPTASAISRMACVSRP
jgi:hypothetical protein